MRSKHCNVTIYDSLVIEIMYFDAKTLLSNNHVQKSDINKPTVAETLYGGVRGEPLFWILKLCIIEPFINDVIMYKIVFMCDQLKPVIYDRIDVSRLLSIICQAI